MTDIVERLREVDLPITREAADEIERLRVHNERLSARVKQLHDLLAGGNEDFYVPGPGERRLT